MITTVIATVTFVIAALLARSGTASARRRCAIHLLAVSAVLTIFVIVRTAAGGIAQCGFQLSSDTDDASAQVRR